MIILILYFKRNFQYPTDMTQIDKFYSAISLNENREKFYTLSLSQNTRTPINENHHIGTRV